MSRKVNFCVFYVSVFYIRISKPEFSSTVYDNLTCVTQENVLKKRLVTKTTSLSNMVSLRLSAVTVKLTFGSKPVILKVILVLLSFIISMCWSAELQSLDASIFSLKSSVKTLFMDFQTIFQSKLLFWEIVECRDEMSFFWTTAKVEKLYFLIEGEDS